MKSNNTDVRSYQDVRNTDALVRHYSVPGTGSLYAYCDGDKHVVVSRGDEPNTQWVKHVPATRESVEQGDTLWTIPDNFKKIVHCSRDNIAYGIYEIPEMDTHAMISVPTNDWLVDAWYGVKKIGPIEASPVGELGSPEAIRELADDERSADTVELADALETVAHNHAKLETDLEHCCEWVASDGIEQERDDQIPVHVDERWQLSFRTPVFRPQELLETVTDIDYQVLGDAINALNDADLLPSRYNFTIDIDTDQ